MKEIWKDIKNYGGLYQVSDLGNIKSLERKVDNGYCIRTVKEKVLKSVVSFQGYFIVSLHKNGEQKTLKIHQLVAIAFLNHTPDGHTLVVNHINFNKKDNRLDNLEIVTAREKLTIFEHKLINK